MDNEIYICTKCEEGGQNEEDKMMSKTKWFALLTLFIIYLLLGGTYFFLVESREEQLKKSKEEGERLVILNNLNKLLNDTHPEVLPMILEEIGEFCDKPIITPDTKPPMWDFYHSVFFAITVCTTIGYGNLAPTTSFSRIFMIAYGLIGIPVNGILFASLGEYFGKTFIRVYRKWKNNKVKDYAASLSLVSQIILYLIPGLIIFLFLPAIVIQHFEKWDYVLSVYYAFVTLTTIGFGDYVAGVYNKGFNEIHFLIYQLFLLIWIIFGLGYLVMVIGFLTRGLRSKKMARLEKHITQNIKTTHSKLWHGFVKDFSYIRRIMNELYMSRLKPVYRDEYRCCAPPKLGSQSFPDLRKLISGDVSPKTGRRRAFSECISSRPLTRVQSDTDLYRIDKEATFASLEMVQPSELLANVATVLTNKQTEDEGGYHGFSDGDILASEGFGYNFGSGWTLGSQDGVQPPKIPRTRAASEVKIPMNLSMAGQTNPAVDWTWSGPAATQQIQELRKRNKFNRVRTKSRDTQQSNSSKSLFERIKSNWTKNVEDRDRDVEKQSSNNWTVQSGKSAFSINSINSGNSRTEQEVEAYLSRSRNGRASVFSVPETKMLEETSVADLLRALTSIHSRVNEVEPKRKLGTASLTPPKLPSIIDLFNPPPHIINQARNTRMATARRASLTPLATKKRRFSLHPVSEDKLMIPPPPYSPTVSLPPPQLHSRRTSLFQQSTSSSSVAPPPNLVHKQVSRLRGPAKDRILYTRTRHNSLKDLHIERP